MRQVRAGLDPGNRLPYLRVEVAEGLESERRAQARIGLDVGFEFVVGKPLHAAVAVVDEHNLFRVQQSLGDDQRPDHVVGDDSARVPDHMRVSRLEPEHRVDVKARVHTGDDRDTAGGPSGEIVAGEPVGKPDRVCQEHIDRVHLSPLRHLHPYSCRRGNRNATGPLERAPGCSIPVAG
jgi:hypothetical protein